MNVDNLQLTVKPENRAQFEKTVISWGTLIQLLGWDMLCEMFVRRVEPFTDAPKLKGTYEAKMKQAKDIIMRTLADDMKAAGLEVSYNDSTNSTDQQKT